MKIGVMVESFRTGLDGGLKAAAQLGVHGVQMYATMGETHFEKLLGTQAGSDLKKKVADSGLVFSAICGDFGHGFGDEAANPKLIEHSKRVVDLTVELGCKVVTTHIGVVPAEKSNPRYAIMARACEELGRYGADCGVTFAIETGPESSTVLRMFLDDIGLPSGMGVNFDPANLAMVIAEDIPTAAERLGKYIVHTHAKDGINLQTTQPEKLYGGELDWENYCKEVPLGEGHVPWPEYITALKNIAFDGFLTIEREVGDNPTSDIELAVNFLKNLLK